LYKQAALKLCRGSLSVQDACGRFVTSRTDKSTHLHPHSYSAEGLLYTGLFFDEEEFISSANRAVKWALDNQASDGGVPKKYDGKKFIPYYRSDILAQILRLGTILCATGNMDARYEPALEKLKEKLISFQHLDQGSQSGGFLYGTDLEGTQKMHLNSWCTMFALQALMMYEDFLACGKKINKLENFI